MSILPCNCKYWHELKKKKNIQIELKQTNEKEKKKSCIILDWIDSPISFFYIRLWMNVRRWKKKNNNKNDKNDRFYRQKLSARPFSPFYDHIKIDILFFQLKINLINEEKKNPRNYHTIVIIIGFYVGHRNNSELLFSKNRLLKIKMPNYSPVDAQSFYASLFMWLKRRKKTSIWWCDQWYFEIVTLTNCLPILFCLLITIKLIWSPL